MSDANQNQNAGAQAQQQLQVKVPDDVQKGTYSNAVSVNVNSNEVVLDFGYLLPNTPAPVIEVVSRVNMNERTAASFLSVLAGAMEDFKKKQAAQAQQQAPVQAAPAPMSAPAPMAPEAPMGPMPEAPIPPYPTNA